MSRLEINFKGKKKMETHTHTQGGRLNNIPLKKMDNWRNKSQKWLEANKKENRVIQKSMGSKSGSKREIYNNTSKKNTNQ